MKEFQKMRQQQQNFEPSTEMSTFPQWEALEMKNKTEMDAI